MYMVIVKTRQSFQEPNSIKKSQKNNIIILNDQEVHFNNITLIGRKDYANKNRKKTKDFNLT